MEPQYKLAPNNTDLFCISNAVISWLQAMHSRSMLIPKGTITLVDIHVKALGVPVDVGGFVV